MKIWYAAVAGALLLGLYTWWIYGLGADSVEEKIITVTVMESARQTEAAGQLGIGDVKQGQRVKEVIDETKQARAPQGCDLVDPGDLRVNALGGVRAEVH